MGLVSVVTSVLDLSPIPTVFPSLIPHSWWNFYPCFRKGKLRDGKVPSFPLEMGSSPNWLFIIRGLRSGRKRIQNSGLFGFKELPWSWDRSDFYGSRAGRTIPVPRSQPRSSIQQILPTLRNSSIWESRNPIPSPAGCKGSLGNEL